jgi:di/tricarboxylate transporter
MTFDLVIVFALVGLAVTLFLLERLSIGLVAIMVMAALMLTGVLTVEEGLSGFSSRATVTIGAMFMLSEGVRRTGILDRIASRLTRTGQGRPTFTLLLMMLTVAAVSSLINNTAAVAIFIPVALTAAEAMKISPSHLLMPISFASMLGGVCTLIGTSTNILVSEIAEAHGMPGIGMFELTPVGIGFVVVGFLFLLTIGRLLIPGRRPSRSMSGYQLDKYISDVVVLENSCLVGRPLLEDEDVVTAKIDVMDVRREGRVLQGEVPEIEPRPGDVLRVHGEAAQLDQFIKRAGLELMGVGDWREDDPRHEDHLLLEVLVAPDSPLAGKRIRRTAIAERLGVTLLAIRQRGALRHTDLENVRLKAGDCLLVAADRHRLEDIEADPAVIVVNSFEHSGYRHRKTPIALTVIAGVVLSTAFGLAPIAVSAIVGVVVMMLTGCLEVEEGLQSVHWEVILLLAGMIPLGVALEKTGGAALIAEGLTGWLGVWGPQVVLSGLLLLTMMLTSILNNQAAAVLLAPMVIQMALSLEIDPRAFLMAVTYGASLSFITPIGYQTNTMIYGPGQYRFADFFRVGFGLNILLWIAGTLLIPLAWPLQ